MQCPREYSLFRSQVCPAFEWLLNYVLPVYVRGDAGTNYDWNIQSYWNLHYGWRIFSEAKNVAKNLKSPHSMHPTPSTKMLRKVMDCLKDLSKMRCFTAGLGRLGLAWAGWKEISALKVKTIQDLVECIIHFAVQPIYLFQQTHCKLVLQRSKITAPPNASTSSLVPPSYPTRATIH